MFEPPFENKGSVICQTSQESPPSVRWRGSRKNVASLPHVKNRGKSVKARATQEGRYANTERAIISSPCRA